MIARMGWLVISALFTAIQAEASILVVAPHPDDDVTTAAGVIKHAVDRAETVNVVYMTNGDYAGGLSWGLLRQGEAVAGESVLGVPETNLLFLGYPDGYLEDLFNQTNSESALVTHFGQSATYGNRGLGFIDYHSYRFGVPAEYLPANVLQDLTDILLTYAPDQIYTTSEHDRHHDHRATNRFLHDALQAVVQTRPDYDPALFETFVWWCGDDCTWPNPMDPDAAFAEIPGLEETGLSWGARESIEVPFAMRSPHHLKNTKYLAIAAHETQKGALRFLGTFIHNDEIFWQDTAGVTNRVPTAAAGVDQEALGNDIVTLDGSLSSAHNGASLSFRWFQTGGPGVDVSDSQSATPSFRAPDALLRDEVLTFQLVVDDGHFSSMPDTVAVRVRAEANVYRNIALGASATASSDRLPTGQGAAQAIDDVFDGYPGIATAEWVSYRQLQGTWIELSWAQPFRVDQVVLYDRPNSSDCITAATLRFSDGSTIQTGPLPNNGAAKEIHFAPRLTTSVRLTADAVSDVTKNVGLAEFQVFGYGDLNQHPLLTAVDPVGAGTVLLIPAKEAYYEGESVVLAAQPLTGYRFSHWSGSVTGTQNPGSLVMGSAASVTAHFTEEPGFLSVSSPQGLLASGSAGGPFTPASVSYLLTNTGGTPVDWSAAVGQSWVSLSSAGGSLAPGASTTLVVSINAAAGALAAGSYTDLADISNLTNGGGTTVRQIELTVQADPEAFAIISEPSGLAIIVDGFACATPCSYLWVPGTTHALAAPSPQAGGPGLNHVFTDWSDGDAMSHTISAPAAGSTYLARFATYYNLITAAIPVGGGGVSPAGSTWHPAGQVQTVTATPNAGYTFAGWTGSIAGTADSLLLAMDGPKSVTAEFLQSGGSIGPMASVRASSESTRRGQLAVKSVDGIVDGYPGDFSREWASVGERAGAWIEFTWSQPYLVDRIVLHDRPNTDDNLLGGSISFSDGSNLAVGPLANGGAGVEYAFPAKLITGLRLTVQSVSSRTQNIGLAECFIFSQQQ